MPLLWQLSGLSSGRGPGEGLGRQLGVGSVTADAP